MIDKRGHGVGIRLAVATRGCTGLSYVLEYVDKPNPTDERVSHNGVEIFVDPKSLVYIIGTEVDYQREGLNEGFRFINPNEKGSCGCGESFHV